MSEINKEHRVWDRAQWTDPEPDTLYVSLESAKPHSEKHVVFSGNATWLTLDQVKEVQKFLDLAVRRMEHDVERAKSREQRIAENVAKSELKPGDRVRVVEEFVAEVNFDDNEGDDVFSAGHLGNVKRVYVGGTLGILFDGDSWEYAVHPSRVEKV